MKMTLKQKGVAARFCGGALLVALAGCGGGSGGTSRPNASAGEIVFISERAVPNVASGAKLFSANLDGSNFRHIPTSAGARPISPTWFPERQKVIYTNIVSADRSGTYTNLRQVNRDGTNDSEFAPTRSSDAAVSPDGRRVVYRVSSSGEKIYLANTDGTNRLQIGIGLEPSWSPDGQRIVYVSQDVESFPVNGGLTGSNRNISVMSADGSNPTRLTFSIGDEVVPHFSPDGSRIVYGARAPGSVANSISVMNADGSNPVTLISLPIGEGAVGRPIWTPDGNRIVFLRSALFNPTRIYAMNADGSNQTPLSNTFIGAGAFDLR